MKFTDYYLNISVSSKYVLGSEESVYRLGRCIVGDPMVNSQVAGGSWELHTNLRAMYILNWAEKRIHVVASGFHGGITFTPWGRRHQSWVETRFKFATV